MRASADRPVSALIAICAVLVTFGLLVVLIRPGPDSPPLTADVESGGTATAAALD